MMKSKTMRRLCQIAGILPLVAGSVSFALYSGTPAFAQVHLDSAMIAEHDRMIALVPTNQATHVASASGPWNSGSTWNTGTVPGNDARVYIPSGRTVTYNSNATTPIRWLRVEGKITFQNNINTSLYVDTIVVDENAEWEQGTTAAPIQSAVRSEIVFTDTGAIDTTTYDPSFVSRGLLAHGKVRICGTTVTPFLKTNSALGVGATAATLQSTPTGWRTGDTIVVSGTSLKYRNPSGGDYTAISSDEQRTLSTLSGGNIGLSSGLSTARPVEYASFGLYPYVSNYSRNVYFRSANVGDMSRRGHVMFMHNRDVDVRYAGFYSLGRTRKDIDVTSSATSALPAGTNPRGRYAVHFHRTGKDDKYVTPSYVQGCAVVNPSSWAFVNHDSFVVFEDNVSHNAFGAAFITENGAELGTFRRNLASTTAGRGFIKDGTSTHDLGRSGVGFWFQGGNVTVENNIATGASSGFSYFERTGVDLGDSQKVLATTLIDPEAAGGNAFIASADTPMMRFFGNTAIGCYEGVFTVDNEINGIWPTSSVLENYTDLNSAGYTAVRIEYYRNFTFKNIKILRDSSTPADSQYGGVYALNANHLVDHLYPWETRATDRHEGVYVRGYWNGVNNDDGDLGVAAGSPERIARHDVINNSVDFVGPGVAFKNTGSLLGQPLLRYVSSADILPFPTFSPAAGTYTSARTVTITSDPGTAIYYVMGNTGYVVPSVESLLKPGTWTQYTGPVTISSTKKLIAIAVKNGIYTRIRNGVYTIDPNAPPPPTGGTGTITHETWTNVAGTAVGNIPVATAPQTTGTLTSLETGTNIADNYGVRVRGYITPPSTGNYTFWVAGDDNCELWLSTNDQPGSKVKIAGVNSWTNSREWNKLPEQKSAVRNLTAGQKYYVEVLMKEGSGGDNLAVGWLKPGQTGTVPSEVVPGSALSPATGGTPPPPSSTTLTLNPTDDRDTQSDNASGTNPEINTSEWNTSYFRFSTGVLSRPVTSAKLRIYKPSATTNVLFKVSGVTSDAWTQATAGGSLPGLGGLITSLTANPAGYIEFDVTNAVRTEAAGDGVFSVAINTGTGNGWIGLTSREGTNKPQLIVVY